MNDTNKIVIALSVFFVLDLLTIGGIFWKSHANFIEVYKHLH